MGIIATMARVSSPIFVGRGAELERLADALELAANHRPATRLVGGDAGIGKTRLVSEFVAGARSSGAQVLIGDCLQLGETGLPYAPFVGALRPVLRSLPPDRLDDAHRSGPHGARASASRPWLVTDSGRPPRAKPAAPEPHRRACSRSCSACSDASRRSAPLVLILEDLHWADSSTRDLLRFLVRNARDARFLIIGTYRSDELHRRHPLRPLLAELGRLEGVDDMELGAFGAGELADQLAGITGQAPDPELVSAVLSRSGGNPFFVEELMAAGEGGLALPRSLAGHDRRPDPRSRRGRAAGRSGRIGRRRARGPSSPGRGCALPTRR